MLNIMIVSYGFAVLTSIAVLCCGGSRKWVWSFLIAFASFPLALVVIPRLPGGLSILYGSHRFHSGSRAHNRQIFRSLVGAYGYLATGVLSVRILQWDRGSDRSQQTHSRALPSTLGKGLLTATAFLVALILSTRYLALARMEHVFALSPLPFLLSIVWAVVVGCILLFWGGSQRWQLSLLFAFLFSLFIWLFCMFSPENCTLLFGERFAEAFSFEKYLDGAIALLKYTLATAACMVVIRTIRFRKEVFDWLIRG